MSIILEGIFWKILSKPESTSLFLVVCVYFLILLSELNCEGIKKGKVRDIRKIKKKWKLEEWIKGPDNLLYLIITGTGDNSYKWHLVYSLNMYWCCPQNHVRCWECNNEQDKWPFPSQDKVKSGKIMCMLGVR